MPPNVHHDSNPIRICLITSLLVHLACAAPLDFLNPFTFAVPVLPSQAVMVDLQEPGIAAPIAPAPAPLAAAEPVVEGTSAGDTQHLAEESGPEEAAPASAPASELPSRPLPKLPAVSPPPDSREDGQLRTASTTPVRAVPSEATPAPLRRSDEFLANDWEKLTYRISMFGLPVGDAELEAKLVQGEVRITLHIRSNPAFSQIYPVDDLIETRHIAGNFIICRIRQREGTFLGDRGFTIFLRDKSVFWVDRLNKRSLRDPLPNSDVVDILSGLYYLRNQPLEVGRSVALQLFDSNRYSPTAVAVLRKEHVTLPALREVDTVVVQPELKTGGIFQRTGAVLIWFSADRYKVPVKVETSIRLGTVTAELVAADSQRAGHPAADSTDQRKPGSVAAP
jgi:hypothetical protein